LNSFLQCISSIDKHWSKENIRNVAEENQEYST